MSVPRLAKLVDRKPSTIYGIENGTGSEGTAVLHRIAAALGVRIEWLEHGTLPKEGPETRETRHLMPITPEETEVGIEWGKLRDPMRTQIKNMVYGLVRDQKLADRKPAKPAPQPRKVEAN